MPNPILSSLTLPIKDAATQQISNVTFDLPASGSSITVDDEISSTSENPVQNKVISAALDGKANSSSLGTAATRDVPTSGNANVTQVVIGSDTRLTNARNAADVYDWAKAEAKPSYTASEVGAIASSLKGANGGVAELDANGKVPSSQLPSFVNDVLEYSSQSAFPSTGETGKIYVATDTNKTYRWSGSAYVEISASLALGETSSTAYRGDRGKTAYDHSQLTSGNPHGVTKSDVGLGNVGNFKAVSTVASQGLSDTEKSNARTNIAAAASSHTHTTTIAADSGTNQLTLAASTKYKLTAGGSSYIFTTPPNSRDFKMGTTRSGASNNTLYFVYT